MEHANASQWLVACLCAQWCGTCRDFRAAFERETARAGVASAWVDIEDEPEVLGPLEIETFPALLIARGEAVAFFGTVTPQPAALARLLRSALAGELGRIEHADVTAIPARVRALTTRAE